MYSAGVTAVMKEFCEGHGVAKIRNAVFLTNDTLVVRFCEENGIKVLDLKDVLILLGEREITSKKEKLRVRKRW